MSGTNTRVPEEEELINHQRLIHPSGQERDYTSYWAPPRLTTEARGSALSDPRGFALPQWTLRPRTPPRPTP